MHLLSGSFQLFPHADFAVTTCSFRNPGGCVLAVFHRRRSPGNRAYKDYQGRAAAKTRARQDLGVRPFVLCHADGSIRRGPHGRCGGDRAPGSLLDAVAPILDLSGGRCSDCRSTEHHPKEIFKVGGHTPGEHASTLRSFASHPQPRGDTRGSFVLGNPTAGHGFSAAAPLR